MVKLPQLHNEGTFTTDNKHFEKHWQIYRVRVSCDVVHGAEHVDHAVVQELDFVQVREIRQTLDFLVLHWERAFS